MVDLTNPFEYIRVMLQAVRGVLLLNPQIFVKAFEYQGSLRGLVFWIVAIAGFSRMLGQSVVLFANRVTRVRFWISILFGAGIFVVDALAVTTVFWIIANTVGSKPWPFVETVRATGLAFAPLWLAFLVLIPYLGLIIERLLQVYVFLAFLVACQAIFGLSFWGGLFAAVIAVLVKFGLDLIFGRLLTPLADRIETALTGVQERTSTREIYELFARKSQAVEQSSIKKE